MKRVAVTGISGYIGSRLLSRMASMPDVEKIIGVDIRPPKESPPNLKFYRQDISEPLAPIFGENAVDAAIHLAFVVKPSRNVTGTHQTDVGGADNFLEACKQAGTKCVLYLSSHTVYGAHPDNGGPLGEEAPLRPLKGFQYSWDKAQAEQEFRDFAANNDACVTILRSPPVIGPNASGSVVSAMFRPSMLFVSGYDPPMQFVHEDDLVELMVAVLSQRKAGVFNVAGDGAIRYSEIAQLCRSRTIALPEWLLRFFMGLAWKLRLQSESPTSGLNFIKYPPLVNTEKLKRELGFQFRYSSKDAVASFVSAWRKS